KASSVKLSTIADRIQERFVKPLALDRLCALVEPCIAAAPTQASRERERPEWSSPVAHAPGSPRSPAAPGAGPFQRLQAELAAYTATPTGVGLDVPAWLRRLEGE